MTVLDDARAALEGDEFVRLRTRWVFPVCESPIADGVVEVTGGRVTAVAASGGKQLDARSIDLGNVALLPGLVNAHAHLEFSDLARPIEPPAPFTEWIKNLMAYRRARTRAVQYLVTDGLTECVRTGTAVVGEIATSSVDLGSSRCGRSTVIAFRECIAPTPERVAEQVSIAEEFLRHTRNQSAADVGQSDAARISACMRGGPTLIAGLSPHAPYTVLPELFEQLVSLARREHVPVAMHLAETKAELEYLRDATGDFRGMLERLGIWRDELHPRGRRPLDYLQSLATLETALAIHGNYFDEDELAFLARHPQIATVYCPRTHRFFGHEPHPWRELLARGATVAIGTDGRSSNPDYSLWSELRLLDEISGGTIRPLILELGTQRGAEALGVTADYGAIAVGRAAAFCVVPTPERDGTSAFDLLFDATGTPIGI